MLKTLVDTGMQLLNKEFSCVREARRQVSRGAGVCRFHRFPK